MEELGPLLSPDSRGEVSVGHIPLSLGYRNPVGTPGQLGDKQLGCLGDECDRVLADAVADVRGVDVSSHDGLDSGDWQE